MKKYLLFDLDGTLTDPKEGITNSVAYALNFFGIQVEDRDTLIPFIGPPLTDSFMEFYGFEKEKALEAVEKYREYFKAGGIFENRVYEGVLPMLKTLKDAGATLILATSKPTVFARQIVERFGLDPYLDDVQGSELDGTRVKKGDVIRHALLVNGIENLDEVLMIGDRMHDVDGAHEEGIQAVGVLFGYGSEEELKSHGADFLVESVEELTAFLLEAVL
jgi:phosphoglycolate phosphatase